MYRLALLDLSTDPLASYAVAPELMALHSVGAEPEPSRHRPWSRSSPTTAVTLRTRLTAVVTTLGGWVSSSFKA
jgi:hypothetical protein